MSIVVIQIVQCNDAYTSASNLAGTLIWHFLVEYMESYTFNRKTDNVPQV